MAPWETILFLTTTTFQRTGLIEGNYKAIRDELDKILAYKDHLPSLQQIQQEQRVLNQDD